MIDYSVEHIKTGYTYYIELGMIKENSKKIINDTIHLQPPSVNNLREIDVSTEKIVKQTLKLSLVTQLCLLPLPYDAIQPLVNVIKRL
jgi:hypothetical protein